MHLLSEGELHARRGVQLSARAHDGAGRGDEDAAGGAREGDPRDRAAGGAHAAVHREPGRDGAGVGLRDGCVHERGADGRGRGRADLRGGVAVRGAAERGEGEGQRSGLGGFCGDWR